MNSRVHATSLRPIELERREAGGCRAAGGDVKDITVVHIGGRDCDRVGTVPGEVDLDWGGIARRGRGSRPAGSRGRATALVAAQAGDRSRSGAGRGSTGG